MNFVSDLVSYYNNCSFLEYDFTIRFRNKCSTFLNSNNSVVSTKIKSKSTIFLSNLWVLSIISCSSVCLVVPTERYASGLWDSRGVWPRTVSMTTACGHCRPMNRLPQSTQGGETGGSGPQTYWIPTTEHLYVRKNHPYWRYTSAISLLTFYHLRELNLLKDCAKVHFFQHWLGFWWNFILLMIVLSDRNPIFKYDTNVLHVSLNRYHFTLALK